MKLPRPYISPSQFTLFWSDPRKYYLDYYFVRNDKPTVKMTFGTIFQLAWCDPAYDYVKALREAGYTPDYARVIRTALEHPATIKVPKRYTERKMRAKGLGLLHPALVILDGLKLEETMTVENKMGVVWNQKRCDEDVQLGFQDLVFYLKYGKAPKLALQSFNSRTGIPTVLYTRRTMAQRKALVRRINDMVTLIKAGDFNPKV